MLSIERNKIFAANMALIRSRWLNVYSQVESFSNFQLNVEYESNTLVVNDIQLTSNYDLIGEASYQAELIPITSDIAHIYGVGLGYLPENLLKRDNIRAVNVHVLNFELFIHILYEREHAWLKDSRIQLVMNTKQLSTPFSLNPAELLLVDDDMATLRDNIVLDLNIDYATRDHKAGRNRIKREIEANRYFIENDSCASILLKSRCEVAIIAAAGPTLDYHIETLQQYSVVPEVYTLIALDAAVKTLLRNDIIPDIVVSIDPKSERLFENVDFSLLKKTSLVYYPRVSSRLLESWQGFRFCAYSHGDSYVALNETHPRIKLVSFGSVIHTATDLCAKMGCKKVIFLGADFGFPDGRLYAEGQDNPFMSNYTSSSHWVFNGKGEKIPTMLNYRGYLRDLEKQITSHPNIEFFNGSDKGANIAGTSLI